MQAKNDLFEVELIGTTNDSGTPLQAPSEKGLIFLCRDTMRGHLILRLRELRGSHSQLIWEAQSDLCGLEIGGESWEQPWLK